MKKVLLYGNCQMKGLRDFLLLSDSVADLDIVAVESWRIAAGLALKESSEAHCKSADVVFYHTISDLPLDPNSFREGCQMIPMSVYYNGGPFIFSISEEDFSEPVKMLAMHSLSDVVRYVVLSADLGYEKRWLRHFAKMRKKEIEDGVPEELRATDFNDMARHTRTALTYNHPTSFLFYHWTNRVLRFLGKPKLSKAILERCLVESNIADLPCYFHIPLAAKVCLGLSYGGTEDDNRNAELEVVEKLKSLGALC